MAAVGAEVAADCHSHCCIDRVAVEVVEVGYILGYHTAVVRCCSSRDVHTRRKG